MLTILAPLALTLTQSAPAAELPELTLEQASSLRCAVAFGVVHQGQRQGVPGFDAYPVMAERGQEFFVRTTAKLMDDLGADRDTIMALVQQETIGLNSPERLGEVMPACLMMLDASGL